MLAATRWRKRAEETYVGEQLTPGRGESTAQRSGLADSLIDRMVAQRDLLQEMDDRCSSIFGHATSPDESVRVEVDGLGAMTGLWLQPHALELEPDVLAKLIVDTAAGAAQVAMDEQDAVVEELNERMQDLREMPLTLWDGTTIKAP
jgi:DNA-binding protein YbaB